MIEYFNAYLKMEQQQKIDKYRILNEHVVKGQVLFTGSSLMEQFPVNELLMSGQMDVIIYNRGVGGFTTDDMLQMSSYLIRNLPKSLLTLGQTISPIQALLLKTFYHI